MGKYSKSKLVGKKWIYLIIVSVILLIIANITFMIYINVTNNIVYENIDKSSIMVDERVAEKSTPIIVNNIVLGAVYNNKWVSMDKYFYTSTNQKQSEVDVFTRKGKTGTFKLQEVEKNESDLVAYTTTTATNYIDEYFAVQSDTTTTAKMDAIPLDDEITPLYKEYVKRALGIYGMLNNTIKINEVYEVALIPGQISYLIVATNDGNTNKGVYSTVVYVSNLKETKLVKYNFVKNVNDASDFGIYTIKFVADLNADKKCEIILQETKEFSTKYSIMEYTKGKFYDVASVTVNN